MRKLLWVVVLGAIAAAALGYVLRTNPPWYERIRYPLRYSEYIRVHAKEHDLDPALMAAVIYQESKFRPSVESSSGAIGLMQLTPSTARGIAIRTGGNAFRTNDLYDPEINMFGLSTVERGTDFAVYPNPRTIGFGLRLTY